jgi:hypothetical protein
MATKSSTVRTKSASEPDVAPASTLAAAAASVGPISTASADPVGLAAFAGGANDALTGPTNDGGGDVAVGSTVGVGCGVGVGVGRGVGVGLGVGDGLGVGVGVGVGVGAGVGVGVGLGVGGGIVGNGVGVGLSSRLAGFAAEALALPATPWVAISTPIPVRASRPPIVMRRPRAFTFRLLPERSPRQDTRRAEKRTGGPIAERPTISG